MRGVHVLRGGFRFVLHARTVLGEKVGRPQRVVPLSVMTAGVHVYTSTSFSACQTPPRIHRVIVQVVDLLRLCFVSSDNTGTQSITPPVTGMLRDTMFTVTVAVLNHQRCIILLQQVDLGRSEQQSYCVHPSKSYTSAIIPTQLSDGLVTTFFLMQWR